MPKPMTSAKLLSLGDSAAVSRNYSTLDLKAVHVLSLCTFISICGYTTKRGAGAMLTIQDEIGDTVEATLHILRLPAQTRNRHQSAALTEARKTLIDAVILVDNLMNRVYTIHRHTWIRPDRHCTVEVGLLADLVNLSYFAGNFVQGSLSLEPERAVSQCHFP